LISTLTIDALGTLLHMEPPATRLREELLSRGVEVSPERAEQAFSREIAYYLTHHVEGRDPDSLDQLRKRCAGVLRDSLGLRQLDLDTVREALLASLNFEAFEDAAPALEAIRERGIRVVAASNWDSSLPEVLERVGLAGLLDGVVSSAVVGVTKPAPKLFRAALALAGADPSEALHVGDSLQNDVVGARSVGMQAILLVRDGATRGQDQVRSIRALTELPDLISEG
jgi:putative hydrolase of the HAD superfamily